MGSSRSIGSAGYAGPYASAGAPYSGPLAAPGPMVTHSNGAVTPADTPAVAAAKAAFRQAGGVTNPADVGAAAGGLLVTLSNGAKVPADTPAIAAAKAAFRKAGGVTDPASSVGVAAAGLLATLTAPGPLVRHANGA